MFLSSLPIINWEQLCAAGNTLGVLEQNDSTHWIHAHTCTGAHQKQTPTSATRWLDKCWWNMPFGSSADISISTLFPMGKRYWLWCLSLSGNSDLCLCAVNYAWVTQMPVLLWGCPCWGLQRRSLLPLWWELQVTADVITSSLKETKATLT